MKGRNVVFSHKSDSWETPPNLYRHLNNVFHFTLDPCATKENAKCPKFYTEEDDGLSKSWRGERVFVNPPYSEIARWMEKVVYEYLDKTLIVMLLPARTDTRWFQQYVLGVASQVYFIKGRLRFVGSSNSAPFPSIIVVYNPDFDIEEHGTQMETLDAKQLV